MKGGVCMKMRADIHYTLHNETSLDVGMKVQLTFEDIEGAFESLVRDYADIQGRLNGLDELEIKYSETTFFIRMYRRYLHWRRNRLAREKRAMVLGLLNAVVESGIEVEKYAGPDTGLIDAYAARQIAEYVPRAHTINVYGVTS